MEIAMNAAAFEPPFSPRPSSAPDRTAIALQTLMHDWEREQVIEEEESESDLMVMLSGMVSPSALALDGE
jgi:hypothetical protein